MHHLIAFHTYIIINVPLRDTGFPSLLKGFRAFKTTSMGWKVSHSTTLSTSDIYQPEMQEGNNESSVLLNAWYSKLELGSKNSKHQHNIFKCA